MIYIAFSLHSHKLSAKIFCKKFRHCAPMIKTKDKFILYQFVESNHIAKIELSQRDLQILVKHGWEFIQYGNKKCPTAREKNKTNISDLCSIYQAYMWHKKHFYTATR